MSVNNIFLDIGKTISFSVYAPAVLGTNFNKVTLLGILDYESAQSFLNVATKAIEVYPSLPANTIKDHTKYRYLKVKMADGKSTCIALEWIKESTYTVHTGLSLNVTIPNATSIDADRVRAILSANGYNDVTISF